MSRKLIEQYSKTNAMQPEDFQAAAESRRADAEASRKARAAGVRKGLAKVAVIAAVGGFAGPPAVEGAGNALRATGDAAEAAAVKIDQAAERALTGQQEFAEQNAVNTVGRENMDRIAQELEAAKAAEQ